jgi:hypothetical protein
MLATERERQVLGKKMIAVEKLMDSMFDACCYSDCNGLIASSTPQLEQMLVGCYKKEQDAESQAAASRGGCGLKNKSLLDFALSSSEKTRIEEFLNRLSRSGVAEKIMVSLTRDGSTLEVGISGIALPENCDGLVSCQESCDCTASSGPPELVSTSIYLGFEIDAQQENVTDSLITQSSKLAMIHEGIVHNYDEDEDTDTEVSLSGNARISWDLASNKSAPAELMRPRLLDFVREGGCASGDCLPPYALAWVEGKSLPTKVSKVVQGERILCHDQLSGGLKYAEVMDASTASSKSDWVVVTLEDDTKLVMTTEHPVFPGLSSGRAEIGHAVRAVDLRPEHHTVEVLKKVAVAVREVRSLSSTSAQVPSQRVALSVRQPERHAPFVAQGDGAFTSMAVASASIDATKEGESGRWLLKNTFIDEVAEDVGDLVRSHSAPCVYHTEPSSKAERLPRRPSKESLASSSAASKVKRARSFMSSYCSSELSHASSRESRQTVVMVAHPELDQQRTLSNSSVKMTQLCQLAADGLQSVGSFHHHDGKCVPCLMQNLYLKGKYAEPCRFGRFCGRCHEHHVEGTQAIKNRVKQLRQVELRSRRRVLH